MIVMLLTSRQLAVLYVTKILISSLGWRGLWRHKLESSDLLQSIYKNTVVFNITVKHTVWAIWAGVIEKFCLNKIFGHHT